MRSAEPARNDADESELVRVAEVSEVTDAGLVGFEIEGSARVLVHHAGCFYALDGICPHEHAELCDGEVDTGTLWCPLHSAGFDVVTGAVVCPPAEVPLKTYAVAVQNGDIFVAVDPRLQP